MVTGSDSLTSPGSSGSETIAKLLAMMEKQMGALEEMANEILAKESPSELDLMAFNAQTTKWSTMVSLTAGTVKTIEDTLKSIANR
ncbi:MAG: hypothetical protein ACRCV3_02585 [Desulfovibrionaceae bacterium]